jgi:hypothetical protein
MSIVRRTLMVNTLRGLVAAAALTAAGLVGAQTAKPIRLLVGFPAGGGTDVIARTLADKLKDELGVPVVPTVAVRRRGLDALRGPRIELNPDDAKADVEGGRDRLGRGPQRDTVQRVALGS